MRLTMTTQRILAAPASTMSILTAADQEDFVSMGMNTAIKNAQILKNAYGVVGIELMTAAQALDLRRHHTGAGVGAAKDVARKHVDFLDEDRPLFRDHTRMLAPLESCEVLAAVERRWEAWSDVAALSGSCPRRDDAPRCDAVRSPNLRTIGGGSRPPRRSGFGAYEKCRMPVGPASGYGREEVVY